MTEKRDVEFLDELDENRMRGIKRTNWNEIIDSFLESDKRFCTITFKNLKERRNFLIAVRKRIKEDHVNLVYGNYSPGIRIYIAKS